MKGADSERHAALRARIDKVREHLRDGDLRGAVAFLNSLTEHRFTGVYLFDPPTAQNAIIVDKEDPETESLPDVPMTATYCSFTKPSGRSLVVDNSLEDPRFSDHPAREEVRSYCGVPMVNEMNEVFGTVCHFDFRVVEVSHENVRLMEAIGPLFRRAIAP